MTSIWFSPETARIRSYTSTSRGQSRFIRIEIEVSDAYAFGDILRQLDDLYAPKPKKKTQLLLEDRRGKQ